MSKTTQKDLQTEDKVAVKPLQRFYFPALGKGVEAENLEQATALIENKQGGKEDGKV